jgi:hypothetical protein
VCVCVCVCVREREREGTHLLGNCHLGIICLIRGHMSLYKWGQKSYSINFLIIKNFSYVSKETSTTGWWFISIMSFGIFGTEILVKYIDPV